VIFEEKPVAKVINTLIKIMFLSRSPNIAYLKVHYFLEKSWKITAALGNPVVVLVSLLFHTVTTLHKDHSFSGKTFSCYRKKKQMQFKFLNFCWAQVAQSLWLCYEVAFLVLIK